MSVAIDPGPWCVRFGAAAEYRRRLICFPNAGGSATVFRPWRGEMRADVDLLTIQFPGRQKRIREKPLREFNKAMLALLPVIAPLADQNTIFFGDCTGALFAYELIRALAAEGAALPGGLLVACCRAPDLPPRHAPLYDLDDAALTEQIRALGFAPDWLLNDAATLNAFLPLLRCDFELVEAYRHQSGPPLPIPITAIAGTRDKITPETDVAAWKAHTCNAFRFVKMDGSHDVAQTHTRAVMAIVSDLIEAGHVV